MIAFSGVEGKYVLALFLKGKNGTPDRIRTCDTRFRKPLLYPTELREHLSSKETNHLIYSYLESSEVIQIEGEI